MKATIFCAAALALAAILTGCESGVDYSGLGLVDVTGQVTLDGQPLPGVTVRFEGPPNRFADGMTDANGSYRLMYDSNQAGCLPGEKKVRIMSGSVGEGSDESAPVEGADGKVAPAVQSIPAKYNSSSEFTANVSPSDKKFNFELKSTP
jgi:hypothetical protein